MASKGYMVSKTHIHNKNINSVKRKEEPPEETHHSLCNQLEKQATEQGLEKTSTLERRITVLENEYKQLRQQQDQLSESQTTLSTKIEDLESTSLINNQDMKERVQKLESERKYESMNKLAQTLLMALYVVTFIFILYLIFLK